MLYNITFRSEYFFLLFRIRRSLFAFNLCVLSVFGDIISCLCLCINGISCHHKYGNMKDTLSFIAVPAMKELPSILFTLGPSV